MTITTAGPTPATGSTSATWPAEMAALQQGFAAPLFSFLLRYARGHREAAEDMVQETMLRAWRRIDTLPASHESQRRWLFTIARHIAIDADRARRVRPDEFGGLDLELFHTDDRGPERALAISAVRDALVTLSPSHRAVLVELYYDEHSLAEAAERLGIPEGTVKSRSHYALRALRAALGPWV